MATMSTAKASDAGAGCDHAAELARLRQRLVAALSLGFAASMLCFRPSVMIALPALMDALGQSMEDGGALLSLGSFAYMLAKPASQIASDYCNARVMLLASLVVSGLSFVGIGLSSAYWQMRCFYVLVVCAQGLHAPAMMAIVTQVFGPKERGTPLGLIMGACTIGNALVPALSAASVALPGGWRTAFVLQGLLCAGVALIVAPCLRFPAGSHKDDDRRPDAAQSLSNPAPTLGMTSVVRYWQVWIIGLNFHMLYVLRFGVEGWIRPFLDRNGSGEGEASQAAALFTFWWSVGGFVGSLGAGAASDRLFCGARSPLALGCAVALIVAVSVMPGMVAETSGARLAGTGLLSGAVLYGHRNMLSLLTRDLVPASGCGKADAITNALAEMGGVLAGLPLITWVRRTDWDTYTTVLLASAFYLCFGSMVLYWNERHASACVVAMTSNVGFCKEKLG